jgi:hypothetical protein
VGLTGCVGGILGGSEILAQIKNARVTVSIDSNCNYEFGHRNTLHFQDRTRNLELVASDTVTTVFGGDDSPFQAAARRVRQAMGGAEHAASTAAAGVKGLESAFSGLLPMVAAIAGVASVFEGVRKAFAQAAEREQAGQQFEAVAGGAEKAAGAIQELEKVSAMTGTDFPELAQGAKRLMEAGLSADEAAEATGRLQKIALNTGSSFEELADIYARVTTKQEVSLKDLTKFAAAGIPGIADIAKQFKDLETATKDSDSELERSNQIFKDQYELTEKNIGAIDSFGQKTGLLQEAFRQFQQSAYRGVGRLSFGGQNLGEQYGAQFAQGMKQISAETGLTERELGDLADKGKLSFEDLIQAAQRFREEQEKAWEEDVATKRFTAQRELLGKQRDLLGEIDEAIKKATGTGGIFENVNSFLSTFSGKWREIQHDIDETFESFGAPLINALKPVLDAVHDQLTPGFQEAAAKFGGWLGEEVKTFFQAFESGDWSKIANEASQAFKTVLDTFGQGIESLAGPLVAAFKSPELNSALGEMVDSFATKIAKILPKTISEAFSAGLTDIAKEVGAALNPFSKEFWTGGFGGTPVTPATTPGTMPTPAPEAAQQPTGGDKVATEATLKAAVDILMKLPLLFTVGA